MQFCSCWFTKNSVGTSCSLRTLLAPPVRPSSSAVPKQNMESTSPSSSPDSCRLEASTFDEFSMQQSLLFSDSLKDLKELRLQLYSAAEYFEWGRRRCV